jgi:hypothetical protein
MDPEVCVQRILDACGEGAVDMEPFLEACEDLAEWLGKGGFVPKSIGDINSSMVLLLRLQGRDAAAKTIAEAQERA